MHSPRSLLVSAALCLLSAAIAAQEPPTSPPAPLPSSPPAQVVSSAPTAPPIPPDTLPRLPVTDAERSAIEVSSLTLDLHLLPAAAREEAHATLILRNRSESPLARIPLQLSSTLHWLSAAQSTPQGLQPLAFTQSPVASDADHTAYVEEAIFTPPVPLAPGASLTLSVFYGGEIKPSADRLELIGAPRQRAAASDWDAIAPTSDAGSTALRGFGSVLWYPVAVPLAQFGNGSQLFDLIARERRRNASIPMRLRLTVDYIGDPPDSVLFNGQLQPLLKSPDGSDLVIDDTHGIATADFVPALIGFRTPSLFLTAQQPVTTPDQLLTVITPQSDVVEPYAAAAASLQPLLAGLLGPTPRAPLILLDHPGEPFEDAGFLAAPLSPSADPKTIAPRLARALTRSWFSEQTRPIPPSAIWIHEGLAEFVSLAWTERTQGREAAVGELRNASTLIALADNPETPQPLTQASADVFLRFKAAFVFWQLRELVGDEAFSQALTAFRHSIALNPAFDRDEKALQHAFELAGKRDLAWFFQDWVYRDRGLPDLTIASANPRPMPARGGKTGGFLVAVEVRNDGDAIADVPVTVRAGTLTATERLRIPGHASASTRVVFEGTPESIEVNDGSVPELRGTTHTLNLLPEAAPEPVK